jgi:serine/threonine-protein kinase
MKRIYNLFITVAILLGWGLNGFASNELSKYYNKDKGFSINLPSMWEVKEGFMGTTVLALSPQENPSDQFRENINVVVAELPKKVALEDYVQANVTNMSRLLTDFQVHEKGQLILSNTDARWVIYSHRMGTLNIKVLVYVLVQGRRGYVITCSAAPEQFPKYKSKFEEIVQSFKFK